jgi:G3E family GTPase
MPVPTNLITGPLGTGKTTAILDLLAHAPEGERWAVLVNELGEVGIDGDWLAEGGGGSEVTVREVAGGCICCTAAVSLRVALTKLLREARPHRLLIEPTGIGHPAGVIDTLRDQWVAKAIDLRATVCLVDPRQHTAERLERSAAYRDQVHLADVLVANKTDLAPAEQTEAFLAYARGLYPPKLLVAATAHGRLDPAWLDLGPGSMPEAGAGEGGHHLLAGATFRPAGGALHHHQAIDRPAYGRRESIGTDPAACGWVFPPEQSFSRRDLLDLLAGLGERPPLEAIVRAKGVLRTGKEWHLFNAVPGSVDHEPIAHRRDSRIELIATEGARPDWEAVEAALNGTRR